MVNFETFISLILSFEDVEQHPHFDKKSFKVKKKIFATLNEKENRACLKFSEVDQYTFCRFDETIIYPVPNKWGKQGWTLINLAKISEEMLLDALTTSYCQVAPPALGKKYLEF